MSAPSSSSSSAPSPSMPPSVVTKSAVEISEAEEKADEYKETWLRMWNNTTNPKHSSCTVAFDIVAWCYGPINQLRHVYRKGAPTICTEQFEDFKLCMKVLAKSSGEDTEGKEMLRAHRRSKEDPRPHIFPMRTQPPMFFQQVKPKEASSGSAM